MRSPLIRSTTFGTTLFDFVDPLHRHPGLLDGVGRALGRHEVKAEFHVLPGKVDQVRLVAIADAEENGAFGRQLQAGGKLRFGERFAEVVGHAHHFAGGFHLRAEDGVDAGELIPREDRRFDVEMRAGFEILMSATSRNSLRRRPVIRREAIFASGTPVAFET